MLKVGCVTAIKRAFSVLDTVNLLMKFMFVCARQAVEEFLAELRCREQSQNADLVSQMTAVKFLMARKFDVSRAIDLFQAYKVQYPNVESLKDNKIQYTVWESLFTF